MDAKSPALSYSQVADRYDEELNESSFWGELARDAYEAIVLKPRYDVIVDVGCGTGLALRHLSRRTPAHARLIGIEPSEGMRLFAQQRNAGIASVELRGGRFENLPLDDASVDYLYSIWAFHWTADPRRAVAEIRRVLKDDGEIDLWFIGLHTGREFAQKTGEVLSRYVDLETRLRAASMTTSLDRDAVHNLFSILGPTGLTITEETTTHYDTLEAHWSWQIRSEAHYSFIPPTERARFDAELRAALESLGSERGIPYTRHSFHVRYRHVDRAFLAVPFQLDDPDAIAEGKPAGRPVSLCVLAAESAEELQLGAEELAAHVEGEPSPGDICATMGEGAPAGVHRLAVVAEGADAMAQALSVAAQGRIPALGARGVVKRPPVVAFMFTGQGSERPGMGRELFETCPAFRAVIERCARTADGLIGASLVDLLCREAEGPFEDLVEANVALFALEVALAHVWRSWGVHPSVVVGHSLGEYAAACVAGVFSLEAAVRLVAGRALAIRDHATPGSMRAVRASEEQIRPYLADLAERVVISAVNAPESLVLSGETPALEALSRKLEAQGIQTTPLQVRQAFHSPLVMPAREPFRRSCEAVEYSSPQIPFVSTVEGGREADSANLEYWARHLREPVQFMAAMDTLRRRGVSAYVEIGPGATLTNLVARCLGEGDAVCVPSLSGQRDSWTSLLAGLGALFAQGVDIDWKRFASNAPLRTLHLPMQEARTALGTEGKAGGDAKSEARRTSPAAPSSWARRLTEAPRSGRLRLARRLVQAEVAALLGREVEDHATRKGLMEIGFDSLRSVALARQLSDRIQQRVSETITFSRPNIDALARFVLDALSLEMEEEAALAASDRPVQTAAEDPIAIVGVGCRLPGGVVDLEGLWRLLEGAEDAVGKLPSDRWDEAAWLDRDPEAPGKTAVLDGGYLADVAGFDPAFFGISPREALQMDPTHRLLLELCWEALEHAMVAPKALAGTETGLFIGIGPSEYEAARPQVTASLEIDAYAGLGTMPSVGVGRISYALGLQGPCFAIDTACSSSLVAIHLACQSLRAGECTMALAGGASLMLSPSTFVFLSKSRALSADGRCKTFSAEADGYGRAEGGAVVVLKRLTRARADGDRVLGLIRGSAINHDGASSGLTAPNGRAQEAVLKRALEDAGCAAPSVAYVEAHGTGTPLGDPIEIEALHAVYGRDRGAATPLLLGSVKTNIGHLEYGAGIAGLLKVILSLREGRVPAHLHAKELNPRIAWADLPLAVTHTETPWPSWNTPRRAGVSSFGLSGTNAHAVLEQAPAAEERAAALERSAELVVLSARSDAALDAQAARLAAHLEAHPDLGLGDLAFSLATTRSAMERRLSIAATSREELRGALGIAARGQTPAGAARGGVSSGGAPKVVFVFPGQGSQWLGMGRELMAEEPVFRAALEACDRAIQAEAGWSLLAELAADEGTSRLGDIDVVQPALFAMAVALAALWRAWGVEPDAVVGHSMGEVAAAHVAGALTLEDAAAIICRRSLLLRRIRGQGEMAVVELSLRDAEAALRGHEDRLSAAVSNSPRSSVLSGEPSALEAVLSALTAKGVFSRRVKVDVASHSPQVDPLREDLLTALGDLKPREAAIPMRSTVTGETVAGPELDARYWADNLRRPVRFAEGVRALLESGHGLFVELSPHPILTTSVEEGRQAASRPGIAVGSLRRGQAERATALEALGALWVHGHAMAWEKLFPTGARRVRLPTYPWQRERYWLEIPPVNGKMAPVRGARAVGHPLLGEAQTLSTQTSTRLWETALDRERLPWLSDHQVQGAVVYPGAAYLEMALSAGAEALGDGALELTDVRFAEVLAFTGEAAVPIQTVLTEEQPRRLRFQVASALPSADRTSFRVHARGGARRAERDEATAKLDVGALRGRLEPTEPARAYEALARMGLEYGPAFQGLVALWRGDGEMLGRVKLPAASGSTAAYRFHPALLDACFQVMAALIATSGEATPWVPVEVGSLKLFQRPVGELWCHARMSSRGHEVHDRQSADLQVVDGAGAIIAEVSGLTVQRLARSERQREGDDWFLELAWDPAPVPAPTIDDGRWLVIGGAELGGALSAALVARGHAAVHVTTSDDIRVHLARAFDGHAPTAVVHLGSLEGGSDLDKGALEASLMRGCDSALAAVQAVAGVGFRDPPRLWLVTRGAQAVGAAGVSVGQAPLLGLGRVIALEHAELRCARVDLDPRRPPREVDALLAELLADDAEEEVALRAAERHVARLVRWAPEGQRRERVEPANHRAFRLEIDEPGVLDRLQLRVMERRSPAPGEVEIAVEAAGLNFIDVMKAMGIYPGQGDGPIALGGECAGRIVAVGEGVESLFVGEEVIALAPFSFGTHVTVDARMVVPRPATLTAAQAAALPIAFMTAWYALVWLGRLQAGERVLIHSATGGTGLAAVQIARHLGAEVFATAGAPEKRAWLCEQGIERVMDSRTLDFAGQILTATEGRGVDVVLNSLSGSAIEASLAALGVDGRFIEIGKTDLHADRPLGLGHFKKSISFHAVDLAGLSERRPERVARLLSEVVDLLARGALGPLPVETFPISRAADAFRKMAQAQHRGKMVLTLDDPEARIRIPAESGVTVRADRTYLVTGGLGGLGLRVADWLAQRGARHLVLAGRSGAASAEQRTAVAAIEARGARVTVAKVDVSNRGQLERLLGEVSASEMPLGGVLHLAGALDDGLLMQQSPARIRAVMAPKAVGALHLHALTHEMPLDFFVLYSSVAGLLGSPGQGNYAAASALLDALAHHRRAQGLPASSIDWGPFAEVGLAAAQAERGARLGARGMRSLTPDEGAWALTRLLEVDRAQSGVVPLDVRRWVEFYPAAASSRMLSRLMAERRGDPGRPAGDQQILDRIAAAEPGARAALLEETLRSLVSQVLRIPMDKLDSEAPLTSLGMDSLMGLELRNRIEAALGVTAPTTLLWTYPTILSLSRHLVSQIALTAIDEDARPPAADEGAGPEDQGAAPLDEDDLFALLDEELALKRSKKQRVIA